MPHCRPHPFQEKQGLILARLCYMYVSTLFTWCRVHVYTIKISLEVGHWAISHCQKTIIFHEFWVVQGIFCWVDDEKNCFLVFCFTHTGLINRTHSCPKYTPKCSKYAVLQNADNHMIWWGEWRLFSLKRAGSRWDYLPQPLFCPITSIDLLVGIKMSQMLGFFPLFWLGFSVVAN